MSSPLAELFRDLGAAMRRIAVRWYVFGAQAAILHGASRLTADVDVTILLGARAEAEAIDAFAAAGFDSRVSDLQKFAKETRVLPFQHRGSGVFVDVVLGQEGLEAEFATRAVQREFEGVSIPVAAAEDVLAMKILSGRAKDLEDVTAILQAQPERLNLDLTRNTLRSLEQALDRSDLLRKLDELLQS